MYILKHIAKPLVLKGAMMFLAINLLIIFTYSSQRSPILDTILVGDESIEQAYAENDDVHEYHEEEKDVDNVEDHEEEKAVDNVDDHEEETAVENIIDKGETQYLEPRDGDVKEEVQEVKDKEQNQQEEQIFFILPLEDNNQTYSQGEDVNKLREIYIDTNNDTFSSISNKSKQNSTSEELFISFRCEPTQMDLIQGTEGSMTCTIENNGPNVIEMAIGCTGLAETGIECVINGKDKQTGKIQVKEWSDKSFQLLIVSHSLPAVPTGSYDFTVIATNCRTDDSCYKD